jgi:hypothetical protein
MMRKVFQCGIDEGGAKRNSGAAATLPEGPKRCEPVCSAGPRQAKSRQVAASARPYLLILRTRRVRSARTSFSSGEEPIAARPVALFAPPRSRATAKLSSRSLALKIGC